MRWVWIENSEGKKDTMLTFAVASILVVLFKVLFGGIDFHIKGETYTFLPIDAGTIGALLTPTLTAYVARRYTDAKFTDSNQNGIDDAIEDEGEK
jgi:hypothetical protein